ncbi:MAG: hypothetical protein AAF412_10035 [Pseudomonadota bacterium]
MAEAEFKKIENILTTASVCGVAIGQRNSKEENAIFHCISKEGAPINPFEIRFDSGYFAWKEEMVIFHMEKRGFQVRTVRDEFRSPPNSKREHYVFVRN